MSFHEKSAWACLLAILFVFVPYFWIVFSNPFVLPAFVVAVALLTAILAVVHIGFALSSAQIRKTGQATPADEREQGIELRSSKIASFLLAAIVISWCLGAYLGIPALSVADATVEAEAADVSFADLAVPVREALLSVHILFAGFVLANVVYYLAMVVGYRRSA